MNYFFADIKFCGNFLQSHVVKQLRQELMNKAEFRGEVHMQYYTNLHASWEIENMYCISIEF